MAKIRDLLVFYGDGERIFADFLATVETKLRSTEETELCRLMRAYGSDKGSHWHNYTILYAALFGQFLSSVRAVFEFGIGSINPNIRAHMGPHGRPGRLCVHGGSFFRRQ